MGLREQNAARTRQLISDSAFALFAEAGFEHATMEAVAARADIGVSTLYRYFSSKDALAVAPLGLPGRMAEDLRAHADLDIDEALGAAVLNLLAHVERIDDSTSHLYHEIVAAHAGPQAQLMDWFTTEVSLLAQALAEQMGVAPGDLRVTTKSWMAFFILWQTNLTPEAEGQGSTRAEQIMKDLLQIEITAPRAPAKRRTALPKAGPAH